MIEHHFEGQIGSRLTLHLRSLRLRLWRCQGLSVAHTRASPVKFDRLNLFAHYHY